MKRGHMASNKSLMITDKQLKPQIEIIHDPSFFCLNVLLHQNNIYSTYSVNNLLIFKHILISKSKMLRFSTISKLNSHKKQVWDKMEEFCC